MEIFWAGVISVVVAFATTLVTEPLRMFFYRNKHIKERRFMNQADWLPKYIEALRWAASACSNVNAGWQIRSDDKFEYLARAIERLIAVRNIGIDVAFYFPTELKDDILTFGDSVRERVDKYLILKNAIAPQPESPTREMRDIFQELTPHIAAKAHSMEEVYRRIVELD